MRSLHLPLVQCIKRRLVDWAKAPKMVSEGGRGRGRGERGGGAEGSMVGLTNPKEPRLQINYTSSEASVWSVRAVQVKEFVLLILFFFCCFFFSRCSVLITADHQGNMDAKAEAFLGDGVYVVLLRRNVIVLFSSVSLQPS